MLVDCCHAGPGAKGKVPVTLLHPDITLTSLGAPLKIYMVPSGFLPQDLVL